MNGLSPVEIQQIAEKIADKPETVDKLVAVMADLAKDNGFPDLTEETLLAVLEAMFVPILGESMPMVRFAGAGAQCCSSRCEKMPVT
jgi:hypothetical protein